MFQVNQSQPQYARVNNYEDDKALQVDEDDTNPPQQTRYRLGFLLLVLTLALCLIAGLTIDTLFFNGAPPLNSIGAFGEDSGRCVELAVRQEWRTLDESQKKDYIRAVQCLTTSPSRLVKHDGTLYDDLTWVHVNYGGFSHGAASFLSWHRYFIHVLERTLNEECGYKGHLPYWNWVLDWEDITKAPIWDNDSGFGGDGNVNGEISVSKGKCVVDGPFGGLKPQFYGYWWRPHCLSRGFQTGTALETLCNNTITPMAIEKVLQQPNYESFMLNLEGNAHLAIPASIRGDFFTVTAPNDPVWFLHHAQLDRLWWIWQQRDLETRLTDYVGPARNDTATPASLKDLLAFGGFVPDIPVVDVMDTTSDPLCYQY